MKNVISKKQNNLIPFQVAAPGTGMQFKMVLLMTLMFVAFGLGSANGQTWGTPVPAEPVTDEGGDLGQYSTQCVVNGNPAIAYYDATNGDLKFVRATDADGTAWGTPVTVDAADNVGQYTSLLVVNGYPAIAYYDVTNQDLKFAVASDADGTTWGTPVALDVTGDVGQYTSMQIVSGNPAIAYYDVTNGDLKYIRATDANATAWGTPVSVDATGNVGKDASMQVANGNPAIAYYDVGNGKLKFARATDATGTAWGTITTNPSGRNCPNYGAHASLQIVNGNPAIAYLRPYYSTSFRKCLVNFNVFYARATDANGSAWGAEVAVATSTFNLYNPSLQIVNGYPAIVYYDGSSIIYIRATNANGSAWGSQKGLNKNGSVYAFPSVQVVNGTPAVSFYDSTNKDLKYVKATDADGTTWGADGYIKQNTGQHLSSEIINGNPAIAYYDVANEDLKYVRATSSSGAAWGTPVTIDATGDVGQYTSIRNINGFPSIAYYDVTNLDLKYVRATDATGTAWGTPVTVDATGDVGKYASLQNVTGYPAIAYYDNTNYDLKYVRATDAGGTTWGTPVTVEATGTVGQYPSLQIVNGNPAIAYVISGGQGRLKYVRATGTDGATWGTPVILDATSWVGPYTSMQIVNGNPAVAYYDDSSMDLKFVMASQADGTTWGTPVTVDAVGYVGQYNSLQTVGGNPAIAYYDATNRALKYAKAGNATGSAWGTPVTLDATGMTGEYASMVNTASGVGIAYYNNTRNYPYYIHEIVLAPEMDVKQGATAIADESGTYDFGSQTTSTNTDVVFTIENTGTSTSTLGDFTITGTDASLFSFQGDNPTTVANGSSATFTVRFAPTSGGAKTATVSFANQDTTKNPYTFALTGIGIPTLTWDGSEGTDWNTAGNWNGNAVPTATDNAIVPSVGITNFPVVSQLPATPAVCKDLTIQTGGTVTIAAGKALTVNGTLTNNAGITGLVVQSASAAADGTGALINGTAGVPGTVERYVSGNLWHLISPAATAGETVASFVLPANNNLIARNTTNYALAPWLEGTGKWDYYKVAGANTGQFGSPAKGFQVMRADGAGTGTGSGPATDNGKLTFKGTLAAANINIPVTKTGDGWNLIGNPYPSALDIAKFIEPNTANTTQLDPSYLAIYVSNIGDVAAKGYSPVLGADGLKLAPGEGFFVKAKTGGGSISFTTAMKSNVSSAFKAATVDIPTIQLTVDDGNGILGTTVQYFGGATKGLDPGKDAGLFNGTDSSFSLFTRLIEDNGVDFTVQALPNNNLESMVVPVGLVADKGATVTFKAMADNLPSGYKVYLEDKGTSTFTCLDEANSVYKVSLEAASNGTGRFYLHTIEIVSAIDESLLNEFKVIPIPEQHLVRIIGNFDLPAKAMVFDMNGKLVATSDLSAQIENTIALNNCATGVYLLKVESGKGIETKKFSWKRK